MMAVGSHPEEEILNNLNLDLDKRGRIAIDKTGATSNEKVFSGGDVAGSRGTVAGASRAGRDAAYRIMEFLNNK
jgi:pyruvate/2-oxoglutarate dehydrogenase complex dihydrolipoamide dehydrogenase (E3) component